MARDAETNDEGWLVEGAEVLHSTFGTGKVVHIGPYQGVTAAWIDFDRGDRKMLDPTYASQHIRLRKKRDRSTRPDPQIRCDICGGRPVVVTVASADGSRQFCDDHREQYTP